MPFGEEITRESRGNDANFPQNAYPQAADGVSQRFTGKERDAETGLDYFGARYFSAAQGRFTSPDEPFADQDPVDPQSWNLFGYVRNNPLIFFDQDGRACVVGPDGKEHDDNSGGQSCADAHKASENNKASATATAQQGSLWAYLTAPPTPQYVENDKPLPENARTVLTQVGKETGFIAEAGDKVAACMAERYLGVPLAAPGAAGLGMVAAGQPILPTRAKMGSNTVNILGQQSGRYTLSILKGGLPTEGTSVAAATSHAVAGAIRPAVGRRVAGVVGRFGRAVPVVGWALTAADAAAIAECVARK